ncbi:MAG: flagellar export protein FliJ [Nitrosomonas sp.]|nr:MAG: flagellar export protein FliJ [Nitrosomonas sp.]
MSKPSSLKILQELAQQQTDASAIKLGKLNAQHQGAEKKLNLLLQYRANYQSHLQNAVAKGIDQTELLNFIAFMNKLDAAISEQRHVVLHTQSMQAAGKSEFLFNQRKLKCYSILSQRKETLENHKALKHEQKMQDEFAANAFSRDSASIKNS